MPGEWVNTRPPPKPASDGGDSDYADDWFNDTDEDSPKAKKASPTKQTSKAEPSRPEPSSPPPPPPTEPPSEPQADDKAPVVHSEESAALTSQESKPAKSKKPRKAAQKTAKARKPSIPEPATWTEGDVPESSAKPSATVADTGEATAPTEANPTEATPTEATPTEAKPVRAGVPLSLQSPPPKQDQAATVSDGKDATASGVPEPPKDSSSRRSSKAAAWLTDSDDDEPGETQPDAAANDTPNADAADDGGSTVEAISAPQEGGASPTPSRTPTPRGATDDSSTVHDAPAIGEASDAPAEDDQAPPSWLSRIAAPRAVSKTYAQIEAERKAAEEAEARRRERYVANLKKNGVSDRIEALGAPRAQKVDPRAGRPPPEIEERQRVANLKFKESSKRRAQEFDKALEREQQRLFARFNEYAVAHGMQPLPEPGDDEDADAAAVAMVLATTSLTGVVSAPPKSSPQRRPHHRRHDELDTTTTWDSGTARTHLEEHQSTSSGLSPSRARAAGVREDGTVRIAGHVSDHPTSTERHTFRPNHWKHNAEGSEDAVSSGVPSPDRAAGAGRARSQVHPAHSTAKAATPTPSTVGYQPSPAAQGPRSTASSTPVPGSVGVHTKRTRCIGAGGLSVIDGAVADFLLGDGNVRHSRVPAMYKRRAGNSKPPVARQ
uniref:Uncharacterized protein n=1 Tax=Neobodo designis TaxID=312471 RepID=A0A7S1PT01_NEODS|mmetsp:Transcript_20422/g.63483  ORF Transcript_20422/g.63483 Transcript_20422/m.63483 type:complete len:665 (+) Transcript_20422:91-2085(+)|eukprot:CAMPEP_0174856560 /NCGR_PEP_ID=MMETSP1114-20130205/36099_1 /TAXON_ID=312471 /ORGANISM="Neobodo designis, Strain CCAP 1951/1" /LENGTH=664 /DNA_ID=CAMNT_0016091361 /DNA_START=89 /DNA_END=2083 /DNA_ORIENTATION=+